MNEWLFDNSENVTQSDESARRCTTKKCNKNLDERVLIEKLWDDEKWF